MLAPIVFFAYSRPRHTEQTLIALTGNDLSADSVIYFFVDGCKPDASAEQIEKHDRVFEFIEKYKSHFKEAYIEISPQNKGLANSLISGIEKVISQHGLGIQAGRRKFIHTESGI